VGPRTAGFTPSSGSLQQAGGSTAAMASIRANDRLSFAMICIMSVASIGGVLVMSTARKEAKARNPTAVEDRLKIFDAPPPRK